MKQMGDIIRGIVAKSRGFEGKYLQALADLAVMREATVDVQGSAEFNAWMRGFKEWLLREGSEHEEFFHLLVRKKVGLIGAEEAEAIGHGVSEEEVAEVSTLPVEFCVWLKRVVINASAVLAWEWAAASWSSLRGSDEMIEGIRRL